MIYAPIRPTWTKAMVQHRLTEAFRVMDRSTSAPMRLRTIASDVPQYIRTEEDRIDILRGMHERLKLEGFYDPKTGLLIKPVPLSWGKGLPPTDSIQRAEEAFWWPACYLADETMRLCLVTFTHFKAIRSHGFPNTIRKRLRAANLPVIHQGLCYSMKDRGLSAIASSLNTERVPIAEMDRAA